jgi:hypothetical protein
VRQSKNAATQSEPLNDVRHQKFVDLDVDRDYDCG